MLLLVVPAFPAGGMAGLGTLVLAVLGLFLAAQAVFAAFFVIIPAILTLLAIRGATASRITYLTGFAIVVGVLTVAFFGLELLMPSLAREPMIGDAISIMLVALAVPFAWKTASRAGVAAGQGIAATAGDDPSSLLVRWRAAGTMAAMMPVMVIVVTVLMHLNVLYKATPGQYTRFVERAERAAATDALETAVWIAAVLLIYGVIFWRSAGQTLREKVGAPKDMKVRHALAQYADDTMPLDNPSGNGKAMSAAAYAALAIAPFVGFFPALFAIAFAARSRATVAGPRERWHWRLLGSVSFSSIGACCFALACLFSGYLAIAEALPSQLWIFYGLVALFLTYAAIADMRTGFRVLTKKREEDGTRDLTGNTGPSLATTVGTTIDEGTRDIPFLQQYVVLPFKALSGFKKVLAIVLLLACFLFPPAFLAYAIFWGAYAMKHKARTEEPQQPERLPDAG
ncbi:MAG: hypothetical protein AAFS07_17255 [Pseudomonadota bacterium]